MTEMYTIYPLCEPLSAVPMAGDEHLSLPIEHLSAGDHPQRCRTFWEATSVVFGGFGSRVRTLGKKS
jgi:hypothetical protein